MICLRNFATELKQTVFNDDDPRSRCHDYNHQDTFEDCDDIFIKDHLRDNYPPGFMPIWATDNFSEVTTHLVTNPSSDQDRRYEGLIHGRLFSGKRY